MKSLAFFSPLSPLPSGVAIYADRLAAQLADKWKIVFYIDDNYTPSLAANFGEIRNHFEYRAQEDLTLYQASNGPMHAYMYPYILKYGGIATLHDSTLYDMAMTYWEGRSRLSFWLDFIRNEGLTGLNRVMAPMPKGGGNISQRILHNLYRDEENKREKFVYFNRVVKKVGGIVTHSKWAADAAIRHGAKCPIMTVPLAIEPAPPTISKSEARKSIGFDKAGLDDRAFMVLAYGYIQRHKRIESILDAWAIFSKRRTGSKLVLVGPRSPDLDIDIEIEKRNLGDNVIIDSTFAPKEKVYNYIYSSDICLNLRKPVYGSTSQTLMEILAAGKACAVTDLETFSEYPDDIVKKISGDENEISEIVRVLDWAVENPQARESMGRRAKQYVESECLWGIVGSKYSDYLTDATK